MINKYCAQMTVGISACGLLIQFRLHRNTDFVAFAPAVV